MLTDGTRTVVGLKIALVAAGVDVLGDLTNVLVAIITSAGLVGIAYLQIRSGNRTKRREVPEFLPDDLDEVSLLKEKVRSTEELLNQEREKTLFLIQQLNHKRGM